jgi:hypothetical protein
MHAMPSLLRPCLRFRNSNVVRHLGILSLLCVGLTSVPFANAEEERCTDYNPERNVYWGDLHIHTSYSMDAYMFDTRLTPEDAYRFARGESRMLPPLGADGKGTVPFQIGRPLDFAAVTDHADAMGGVRLCTDPKSGGYKTGTCAKYRSPFTPTTVEESTNDIVGRVNALNSVPLCGEDGKLCREALVGVWKDIQSAAAKFDDPRSHQDPPERHLSKRQGHREPDPILGSTQGIGAVAGTRSTMHQRRRRL